MKIAQTFVIDLNSVGGSQQVNITSIDLYIKVKPYKIGNASGVQEPGVNIYIVPTAAGGIPNYVNLDDYAVSRKEYAELVSSADATQVTNFKFTNPIPVAPGKEYAIVIKSDNDEEYDFWAATKGETTVNDKTISVGLSGKFIGNYFELSSASPTWQSLPYKCLKFAVYVAKYSGLQPNVDMYMNNYEFVTYDQANSHSTPIGGEYVFQYTDTPQGTCAVVKQQNYITTTGGSFNGFSGTGDPCFVVVQDGSTGINVRRVIDVSGDRNTIVVDRPFSISNTAASFYRSPVAKIYLNKNSKFINDNDSLLVLSDSSANSTLYFTNNATLVCEITGASIPNAVFHDILVHYSEPHVYVNTPPGTSFNATQIFKYSTNDDVTGIDFSGGELNYPVTMYSPINLDVGAPVMLKSRSNEVVYKSYSSTTPNQSSRLQLNLSTSKDFVSPQIDFNATDVFFTRYIINNDAIGEETNNGNAYSKHITTKINFNKGRQAEDLVVYLDAYKPEGTEVRVYAKLFNANDSDYFDDKTWTLLQETTDSRYSSSTDTADYVEYTYGLPTYPDSLFTVAGSVSLSSGSAIVTGSGTNFTNVTTITGVTTTTRSNNITTTSELSALRVGMLVSGSGIPDNTYVTAISSVTAGTINTITLSKNATVGAANLTILFSNVPGLQAGDLVKIYQPLFPEDYIIAPISSITNSTSLTLGYAISAADIANVGTNALAMDKIEYPHAAFKNTSNSGTIRYFNSNMAYFDKYDTFCLKVVFLSNSQFVIPKVKDIRAIGVSA